MSLVLPPRRELLTGRGFARHVLKQRHYDRQDEVLDAIDLYPRVAIKGGHSVGKTRVIAACALTFLHRYEDAIVLTTAPTWQQVRRLLWGNLDEVIGDAGLSFPKRLELEIAITKQNYMLGLATDEGVRFQGFHSGHMLLIFDEAPGVRPDIYQAAEGIAAGGMVKQVALGNPTTASGAFFEMFEPGSLWHGITISAFDTPNLRLDETGRAFTIDELLRADPVVGGWLDQNPWPKLTTRRWVRERYEKYGPNDAEWQARVMGVFPSQSEDALISLGWLREAQRRGAEWRTPGADFGETDWTCGIDVAGEGDAETVVAVAHGDVLVDLARFPQSDPRQAVLDFLAPYRERLVWGPPRPAVRVDNVGVGDYFKKWLDGQGFGTHCVGVNAGDAPDAFIPAYRKDAVAEARRRFSNLKARLYWALRERLREGRLVGKALDHEAVSQLSGLRYKTTDRGRIEIESKRDARRRGAVSPDVAEAIMLCMAPITVLPRKSAVAYVGAVFGSRRRRDA